MKKVLILLAIMFGVVGVAPAAYATEKKVYVCHWANGNPNIIHISENALGGHFDNHGDPVPGHEYDLNFGSHLSDSEEDSCTGRVGPQGPPGTNGTNGTDGANCYDHLELEYPTTEDCIGPPGTDGSDGSDGSNGENGSDGESIVGPEGPAGADGIDGVDGKDVDPAIVTELNNRLFILEHAVPDYSFITCDMLADNFAVPAQLAHLDGDNDGIACESDQPNSPPATVNTPPTGELPHTGSGATLAVIGGLVLLSGAVFLTARKFIS